MADKKVGAVRGEAAPSDGKGGKDGVIPVFVGEGWAFIIINIIII